MVRHLLSIILQLLSTAGLAKDSAILHLDLNTLRPRNEFAGVGFVNPGYYDRFSRHTPPLNLIWQLSPTLIRANPGLFLSPLGKGYHFRKTEYQAVLSDRWLERKRNSTSDNGDPKLPGLGESTPGDDLRTWMNLVQRTLAESSNPAISTIAWDVMNEPNHSHTYRNRRELFYSLWDTTYKTIKASRCRNKVVVGPSISRFDTEFLFPFILHTKQSGTLPDVISWHEVEPEDSPFGIVARVNALDSFLVSEGISRAPVSINEYGTYSRRSRIDSMELGSIVAYIASLNMARVSSAAKGCWMGIGTMHHCEGAIDGLITQDHRPRGAWWLFRSLAESHAPFISAISPPLGAVAFLDTEKSHLQITLGTVSTSRATVILSGMPMARRIISARISKIPHLIKGSQANPRTTGRSSDLSFSRSEDSIITHLGELSHRDAYVLDIKWE